MAFKITDYTGQKYHHLTILRPLGSPGPGKHCIWEMRCDCGNITNKSGHDVARGGTRTCGTKCPLYRKHIPKMTRQEKEQSNRHTAYQRYCKDKRNWGFTLSEEEFIRIVTQMCYYCGESEPKGFVGIDRINNTEGYIQTNCVPCCQTCNFMKGKLSYTSFINKIRAINELHK